MSNSCSTTPETAKANNVLESSSNEDNESRFRIKAGIFLLSVTGISAMIGFGSTLAAVKKRDPTYFNKGIAHAPEMAETGAMLAMKALGWGTLYAVSGCSLLMYGLWKLSGANDFKEFRQQVGSVLPKISSDRPPSGRTEFEGLTDLLTYLASDKWSKKPSGSE